MARANVLNVLLPTIASGFLGMAYKLSNLYINYGVQNLETVSCCTVKSYVMLLY